MVILCIGDRDFYPSGQEGFLEIRCPASFVWKQTEGFLGPSNRSVADVAVSDGMDLGGRFRAACLHIVALSVHPGRKQTLQSHWLCPWVRGQPRSLGKTGSFQKGGDSWSPFICTAGKRAVQPSTPSQGNSPPTPRTWKPRQDINWRKSCH